MKPIKLSLLIEALEFESEEHLTRIDLLNGCVVRPEHGLVDAAEEEDEESSRGLPDWQKEEMELARAIQEEADGRFVEAPRKFDFHEYRHMERFIGTVGDPEVADRLWRAIKGRGAFRHFKDAVYRLGLLDRWHQCRDDAMKEFVKAWAEIRKIPIIDDTQEEKKS